MDKKNTEENRKNIEDLGETVVEGISSEELEKIREKAIKEAKNTKHNWRLVGGWLKCDSCPLKHGSFIGTDYIITGIDNKGLPILEKISLDK